MQVESILVEISNNNNPTSDYIELELKKTKLTKTFKLRFLFLKENSKIKIVTQKGLESTFAKASVDRKGGGGEAVGLSCLQYLAARYSCQLHRSRRSAFPKGFFFSP